MTASLLELPRQEKERAYLRTCLRHIVGRYCSFDVAAWLLAELIANQEVQFGSRVGAHHETRFPSSTGYPPSRCSLSGHTMTRATPGMLCRCLVPVPKC